MAQEILYVAPKNSGGKVKDWNQIEVRVRNISGFSNLGKAKINHPLYKGTYQVLDIWNAGDGGGSIKLKNKYIKSKSDVYAGEVPSNKQSGTIEPSIGTASEIAETATTTWDTISGLFGGNNEPPSQAGGGTTTTPNKKQPFLKTPIGIGVLILGIAVVSFVGYKVFKRKK